MKMEQLLLIAAVVESSKFRMNFFLIVLEIKTTCDHTIAAAFLLHHRPKKTMPSSLFAQFDSGSKCYAIHALHFAQSVCKINEKCEMHRMRSLSAMVSRFVRKSICFTVQLAICIESWVVELRLATSFRYLFPLIAYSLWCAMRMQFSQRYAALWTV